MRDSDFEIAMKTFADLWPKAGESLNREQLNVYRMAFGNHTAEQIQAVMRDLATTSEKWPTPAAIKSRLQARRKSGQAPTAGAWDTFRAINPQFSESSDDDCELASLKWEFDRSAQTYGANALSTRFRWWAWQAALIRQGKRTDELSGPHHSEAFWREYVDRGGLDEATTIEQSRKQ